MPFTIDKDRADDFNVELPEIKKESKALHQAQTYKAGNTGAMICFFPGYNFAEDLAIPGASESPDDLHLTLAYLGKAKDIEHPERLLNFVASFALAQFPIKGKLNGIARFVGTDNDNDPAVCLYDSPALPQFRQDLVNGLKGAGIYPIENHGFIPHITLDYIPPEKPMDYTVAPLPLNFYAVWVVLGETRFEYELIGELRPTTESKALTSEPLALTGLTIMESILTLQGEQDEVLGLFVKGDQFYANVGDWITQATLDAIIEVLPGVEVEAEAPPPGDGWTQLWPPVMAAKAGARNSRIDLRRIQAVHDLMCELGAKCKMPEPYPMKSAANGESKNLSSQNYAGLIELSQAIVKKKVIPESEQPAKEEKSFPAGLIGLSESLLILRHGKHNQKTHGWRYSGGQSTRKAFKDSSKEERETYKARARAKAKKTGESTGAKDDYTPEYWDQQKQISSIKKNGEFYPGELQEATDAFSAEKSLSDTARKAGYEPGKMTADDWDSLAGDLNSQAKDELSLATKEDIEAAGNRAVGRKRTTEGQTIQVGGQDVQKKWTGGSQKQAAAAARDINQRTARAADDYMAQTLSEYGYSPGEVSRLSYRQKKKVFDEMGRGTPVSNRIDGLDQNRRLNVMRNTSDSQRTRASNIGANPRAGRGLDTWFNYEMAMNKAGKAGQIEPFPDVIDSGTRDAAEFVF